MTIAAVTPDHQDRLRDRFRGALLGSAVGDALGAPLEFLPPRAPDRYLTEMVGGGWLHLAPGEWTDDTQLTLATVDSLLVRRVFDPDDIARRFVAWYEGHPPDIGNHTRRVLEAIQHGTPWEQASLQAYRAAPDNSPNGSLMRCSPLALFFYSHPEFVATLSPVLSRITHAHPDCENACIFLNVAIAHLLNGQTRTASLEAARDACTGASQALRDRIGHAMQPQNDTSPSGWVLATLEVAVWAFLHTSSLESALLVAINRGNDADTVGAVTGALAGAYYGVSNIPDRWLGPLHERARISADADRLLALAQSF
jgi:ADP-ribosyl-[dinitrogen reductase] hydrolase